MSDIYQCEKVHITVCKALAVSSYLQMEKIWHSGEFVSVEVSVDDSAVRKRLGKMASIGEFQ